MSVGYESAKGAIRSLILVGIVVALIACGRINNMKIPDAVDSQTRRAVKVGVRVGDQFDFKGTGFAVIRRGRVFVVCNEHTINRIRTQYGASAEITVGFQEPTRMHLAQVHSSERVHDLAVLRTALTSDEEDLLGKTKGAPGLQVYTLGYSDEHAKQEEPVISSGRIDFAAPFVAEKNWFITEGTHPGPTALAYVISGVTCSGGSSGSAVLDGSGRILGYIKGRQDDGKCVAISINRVVEILAGI